METNSISSQVDDNKNKITLKMIKSKYIIREVFKFLENKKTFQIMIYNKVLQKLFDITIEDYKHISGKYNIIEKDGTGKEYDLKTNKLIFEGEYKNRKKNGKGKLYNKDGKLIFEGEYLNNKKNGKGKEYYYNGKLIFEGEYLNNKKWYGIGYDIKGNKEYEINNGNGKIKEYNEEFRISFEGELLNGEKNGKGKSYNIYGQ